MQPDRARVVPVSPRAAWLVVAAVWAGYFLVRTLDAAGPVERVAKGLLMPALLLWVLAALGPAAPRWLVAGLVFATVGDIAIDVTLEAGLVGFLVMQICYIAGFLALGAAGGLRRRWRVAAGYAAVWIGVNAVLGPSLGDLQAPV